MRATFTPDTTELQEISGRHDHTIPRLRRGLGNDEQPTRAEEVREMQKSCYYGRTGEIEDREPVATDDGGQAQKRPDCGHLDNLDWLPEKARQRTFKTAERRQPKAA